MNLISCGNRFITCLILTLAGASGSAAQVVDSTFVPLAPCRVFDSRAGGAPPLAAGSITHLAIKGQCGVPEDANAAAVSVHALQPATGGTLLVWDSGVFRPAPAATLSFNPLMFESAGTITKFCHPAPECSGVDTSLWVSQASHVTIDVTGYFHPLAETSE